MAPKRAQRKRQTKLNFSPAAKPSPASQQSPTTTMGSSVSRSTNASTRASNKPVKASKRSQVFSSSEDELQAESEGDPPRSMPAKSTQKGMFDRSNLDIASSQSSEEEEEQRNAPTRSSRKRRRANDGSDEDDHQRTSTTISRKRQRREEVKVDSSEEDDKSRVHEKRRITERLESTDEEEQQLTVRRTRKRATKRQSPPDEEVEEQLPTRSRKRRVRQKPPTTDEEEEDEEEDVDVEKPVGQDNSDEQDDLREDLAFLRSSPLPDRGRLRSTHEKPKNERQKALEALKKRRAGNQDPPSSSTPGRKKRVVIESESDSELEVIKEERSSDQEIPDEEDIEDDEDEDREANALDMFHEDIEDAGFINDSDDALIGEPSAAADLDEMRLAFSISRAKSKELFRHAVEWMVMKKIHPGFNSTSNIYTLTFRKLDDEVKGLAGSKFTSSAWTPDFTRSIRARPDLMIDELSSAMRAVMSPHCEACNRSNHTATFELMLTGQPYDAETLEPLASNSESDSNSDSDSDDSELSADSETLLNGEKPTYDAQGERLPPESHRFPLGSTCKANAQVAHTLHHWRYHLYQWVKDYLAREGHLTAEKLVKRDKSSDRKKQKAALKIVDRMERDGEIQKLYRLYKEQVEFALEAQNDYKAGWGRRR